MRLFYCKQYRILYASTQAGDHGHPRAFARVELSVWATIREHTKKAMLTWKSKRSPLRVHLSFQANMATCRLWTIQNSARARTRTRAGDAASRRRVSRRRVCRVCRGVATSRLRGVALSQRRGFALSCCRGLALSRRRVVAVSRCEGIALSWVTGGSRTPPELRWPYNSQKTPPGESREVASRCCAVRSLSWRLRRGCNCRRRCERARACTLSGTPSSAGGSGTAPSG